MADCQSPIILNSNQDKAKDEQLLIDAQSSPSLSTQPSDSPNSKSFASPVKPAITNLNGKRKASSLSDTNVVKDLLNSKEPQSQAESVKELDKKQSEVLLHITEVVSEESKAVIVVPVEESQLSDISQSNQQEQNKEVQEKVENPNLGEKVLLENADEKIEEQKDEIEPAPKKKQKLENLERAVNYIMLGVLVGVILFRTSVF